MASRAEDSDDVDTEFTHPPTDIFHPFLSDTPLGWVVRSENSNSGKRNEPDNPACVHRHPQCD